MKQPAMFKFRLYVVGDTPNSVRAIANLGSICREHLPGRHEIEIVDVLREPKRALTDGIYMTPALVRLLPSPMLKIIGTLSQAGSVLQALGMETVAA